MDTGTTIYVIDARGGAVMAGFNDSHAHLINGLLVIREALQPRTTFSMAVSGNSVHRPSDETAPGFAAEATSDQIDSDLPGKTHTGRRVWHCGSGCRR